MSFTASTSGPIVPRIDLPQLALCADDSPSVLQACPNSLTPDQLNNYNTLTTAMNNILASQPACPGDGNEDLLVNDTDLSNWQFFSMFNGGGSSWYDFNFDGLTDAQDEAVIEQYLGANCQPHRRARLAAPVQRP